MKINDLIRGYFDNALSAEDAAKALTALPGGSAQRALQIIETDWQARRMLADFEPPEGAAERIREFVRSRSLAALAPPQEGLRRRRAPAALRFEVVGFEKSDAGGRRTSKPRRPKKPRSKRSNRKK